MMRKKTFLGILILAVMAGLTYAQPMRTPINVSNNPGFSYWAQSAMTPDGVVHVCWEEMNKVMYASFNGKRVSTPLVLKAVNTQTERPYICASANGNVFVVWDDAGGVKLREYDASKGIWLPIFTVSLTNGLAPSASADANGNVFVSYGWGNMESRSRINGRWEQAVLMSSGRYSKFSSILAVPNGVIWCTWGEKGGDGNYKTNYRKRTITSRWTAQKTVNTGGGDQDQASLSYDPTTNIPYIIWNNLNEENGFASEVIVTKIDEKSNPMEKLIDYRLQHYPKMIFDKNGAKHVAVEVGSGDYGLGLDYMTNKGGSWSGLYRLPNSAGHPRLPGLSSDGPNVALVWTSIGGSDDKDGSNSEVWLSSVLPVANRSIQPPTNLAASTSYDNGKVNYNLSWTANPKNPEANVSGYNIYFKRGSSDYTLRESVSKTTFSTILPFTTFDKTTVFAITTRGTYGNETGKAVFSISYPEIKAPSNPIVSVSMKDMRSNPQITYTLSWQANSATPNSYIQKYRIYKKTATGAYQLLSEVSASTLTATHSVSGTNERLFFGVSSVSVFNEESPITSFLLGS